MLKIEYPGPTYEELLALIQTIFGENSHAISTLTRLLQTSYDGWLYGSKPPILLADNHFCLIFDL